MKSCLGLAVGNGRLKRHKQLAFHLDFISAGWAWRTKLDYEVVCVCHMMRWSVRMTGTFHKIRFVREL